MSPAAVPSPPVRPPARPPSARPPSRAQQNPSLCHRSPDARGTDKQTNRTSAVALRPDTFEGMRFEITRPLNQNFFLTHSLFLGNMEAQGGPGGRSVKLPTGQYEFGANVIGERHFVLGRVTTDGRLSARVMAAPADWLAAKLHVNVAAPGVGGGEEGGGGGAGQQQANFMLDVDARGADWNGQVKLGSPSFYGLNYLQSVTPELALGGEIFYLAGNLKSGVGVAARHAGEKHAATAQVATTGIVNLTYAHRVTDKVTLASEFMWSLASREATATVGYDCALRQARLRGKVDTAGVVSCLVEERFAPGINFLLSAELDHPGRNYRFGFGFTCGE